MNIVISKKSWHYRLARLVYKDDISVSICGYFWQIVLLPVMGIFFLIVITAISPLILWTWVSDKFPHRATQDGPFVSYLKARKQKICPLIEFK